jgi:hypothetical protein
MNYTSEMQELMTTMVTTTTKTLILNLIRFRDGMGEGVQDEPDEC